MYFADTSKPPIGPGHFFTSGAGALTLVILAAILGFGASFYFRWKDSQKAQTVLLVTLTNAISPTGRRGLVERVENLELVADRFQAHKETSEQDKRLLESAIDSLKVEVKEIREISEGHSRF